MAIIPKYNQQRSLPGTTGQQMAPLSLVGSSPLKTIGDVVVTAGQMVADAGNRVARRNDVIAKARLKDAYEQSELQNYTAFLDTADLLDINQVDKYNAESEKRLQQTLSGYSGTPDGRAELEATLRGRQTAYRMQVIQKANTAQREFIFDGINKDIASLASNVVQNPSKLNEAFSAVDAIIEQKKDVLTAGDERHIRDQSYSLIMEQGVGGLITRGKWKDARDMMADNPLLMRFMQPARRQQFETEIRQMADKENAIRQGIRDRVTVVNELRSLGFNIDIGKAANFVAGFEVTPDKTFAQQTNEKLKALGLNPEDATVAQRAAVMGIKMPETSSIDPNKDKYIDGTGAERFTSQGVTKMLKPYIEAAIAVDSQLDGILAQFAEYQGMGGKGNELAGLGIIQTYLKMIDDGAVVRESDIAMAEQASPFYDRMKKFFAQYSEGQAVSATLVKQAKEAAFSFAQQELERSKAFIDGYQQDSGYGYHQIGLPGDTYKNIFSNVKALPEKPKLNKTAVPNQPPAPSDGFTYTPNGFFDNQSGVKLDMPTNREKNGG